MHVNTPGRRRREQPHVAGEGRSQLFRKTLGGDLEGTGDKVLLSRTPRLRIKKEKPYRLGLEPGSGRLLWIPWDPNGVRKDLVF